MAKEKKNYQPVLDDLTPIITNGMFKRVNAFIALASFGIVVDMDYLSVNHMDELRPIFDKHLLNWIIDPKGEKLRLQMWFVHR